MKRKIYFSCVVILVCLAITACEPLIGPKFGLDNDTLERVDAVNATVKGGFGLNAETRQLIRELNETLKTGVRPFDDATLARIDRLLTQIENGLKIGLDQPTLDVLDEFVGILEDAPQDWQSVGEKIIKALEGSASVLARQMKRDVNEVIDHAFKTLDWYTTSTITGAGKEFRCNVDFVKDTAEYEVNKFIGKSIIGQIKGIITRQPVKQPEKIAWVCHRMPQEVVLEWRDDGLYADEDSDIIRFIGYNFTEANKPTIVLVARDGTPLEFPPIYPYPGDQYVLEFSLQGKEMNFSEVPEGARFEARWPNTPNRNGIGLSWPHEKEAATLTIKQDEVIVRKGPGDNYHPAGWVVGNGTVLNVEGGYQDWWKVYSKDGIQVGWVPVSAGERNQEEAPILEAPLPPPKAEISCRETSGYAPLEVTCTATLTAGAEIGLDWSWDFGDNSDKESSNPTKHTYAAGGTYTVSLDVSNSDGKGKAVDPVVITVTTMPDAPIASFTASILEGDAPLKVTFTNTTTGNPPIWKWDFNDGSTFSNTDPYFSPDQLVHVAHEFEREGTYHVTLTVTDDLGQSSAASADITVRSQVPIYPNSLTIVRYENLESIRFDDDPNDGVPRLRYKTGLKSQDFVCGIIGLRVEGTLPKAMVTGILIKTNFEFLDAYMSVDEEGHWWINASVNTENGEPTTWDIDTLCVHNNVFNRGGAIYIPYNRTGEKVITTGVMEVTREDLNLNSAEGYYAADTGISAQGYHCGIVGLSFNESWYGPDPDVTFQYKAVAEGNWFIYDQFQDTRYDPEPAVWTRTNVLCLSNDPRIDILYPTLELPSEIGQYFRRVTQDGTNLHASNYRCGIFGVEMPKVRLDTDSDYQDIFRANVIRTQDNAWELWAGMPLKRDPVDKWSLDLVCINNQYVFDVSYDCSSGHCSLKP